MLTKEQFQKLAEKALSFTSFPEASVSMSSTESAFIRFALNGVTTSGFVANQSMGISVTKDRKSGNTSVDDFDEKAIRDAVQRAEQIAMISPANPEDVPPLPKQKYAEVDNFVESTAGARNPVMAPHVKAVIDAAKSKGLVAAGYFERSAGHFATANKEGNFGFGRYTDAYLSSTVRNSGGTSSGWAGVPAVRIEEISGEAIGRVAAEEGRSFLSKKGGGTLVGEKLFPEFITLHSDPFDKRYPTLPWGSGGLAAAPVTWVENGVVKNLFYDRYWAMKSGHAPSASFGNLILDGGTKTLEELIAGVDRGLLVTRFWYIRTVNPQTVQLTGLTRDGLFLIEEGKVTRPVVNFRFNESPVRMLQNTIAMGKPVRTRGGESGMIVPPMVVKEFPFTSVSDAV
jgi:predicted Zn-dependent protease